MAVKKNLLQLVRSILSDMDSEDVTTLADSIEAQQVASIVEDTYYNLITTKQIPEHQELIKLTALSDSTTPSHFRYPDNVKLLDNIWYKDTDDIYQDVKWMDPLDFLNIVDCRTTDIDSVADLNGGTTLNIHNDRQPTIFTSFDDYYIVMDSYDKTREATLQETNARGYATVFPVFLQVDSYVPDIDDVMFPLLLNEAKSVAMSVFKGGSDPKIEQAARRQKSFIQSSMHKTTRTRKFSKYGRS